MTWAIKEKNYSQRRACRLVGLQPQTYRMPRQGRTIERCEAGCGVRFQRRRFGYRRLGLLLARQGIRINHKKLYRLYKEERLPCASAVAANALWARGADVDPAGSEPALVARLRDGYARQRPALPHPDAGRRLHPGMPGLVVDTSLTALRVVRELGRIIEIRSCPRMIVSDNGTEFTSNLYSPAGRNGIEWHYIAPGNRQNVR